MLDLVKLEKEVDDFIDKMTGRDYWIAFEKLDRENRLHIEKTEQIIKKHNPLF